MSFISSLLVPPEWKTPTSEKKVVGTHLGKLSAEARAVRKIKNARTKAHQPEAGSNGMRASCRSYGCRHRKHGGKNFGNANR